MAKQAIIRNFYAKSVRNELPSALQSPRAQWPERHRTPRAATSAGFKIFQIILGANAVALGPYTLEPKQRTFEEGAGKVQVSA